MIKIFFKIIKYFQNKKKLKQRLKAIRKMDPFIYD